MPNGYRVVVYQIGKNEVKLVVAKRGTVAECRTAMRQFCGKGWDMERRPDVHSWGDIIIRFEKDIAPKKCAWCSRVVADPCSTAEQQAVCDEPTVSHA